MGTIDELTKLVDKQFHHPHPYYTPTHAEIALKAYEIWQRRGGGTTSKVVEVEIWLFAEALLRNDHCGEHHD